MRYTLLSLAFLTLILTACAAPAVPPPTAASDTTPDPSFTPAATLTRTPRPTATLTPNPSRTPTASATPNPFAGLTIPALARRSYGGGDILVTEELDTGIGFARYLIQYPSDGIIVTGLMNVPYPAFESEEPYPVIIVNHGYIEPDVYYPGLDSSPQGDFFAQQGYVVIMPDYRGYASTAGGPDPMRIPYAIDVLNLVESLDSIDYMDENRVGMVGHSMGGGVATYVMVLSDRVDAISFYGSMNASQATNWYKIHEWSPGAMNLLAQTYGTPAENPDGYEGISPANYLDRVQAPIHIHHGQQDSVTPLVWSQDLYRQLQAAGADVTLYTYPEQGHTFTNPDLTIFLQRDLEFFDRYVKNDTDD